MMARRGLAAGALDGKPQHLRIGLLHAERILAANRGEMPGQLQRVQEPDREPFELVGADRETMALAGQVLERRFKLWKRPRVVGDMRGVMFDERGEHPIELGFRTDPALGGERAFDHASCAAADHAPGGVVFDRRQALPRQNEVERRNEIGSGIDQRAVEIENDGEHVIPGSGRGPLTQGFSLQGLGIQGPRIEVGRRLHTAS